MHEQVFSTQFFRLEGGGVEFAQNLRVQQKWILVLLFVGD